MKNKNWMTHGTMVNALSQLTSDFDKDNPAVCLALAQKLMPAAEFEFKDQKYRLYAFWFDKLSPAFIRGIFKR
jgi:hypothetical protein